MTMETKQDIFKEHLSAYLKGGKAEKGQILKAVCQVAGYHKKAAIRKFKKLANQSGGQTDKRDRNEYYTMEVSLALKTVLEAGGEVCGELLFPQIAEYVKILQRDKMWQHGFEATTKLLEMSEGTLKRRVGAFKKVQRNKHG